MTLVLDTGALVAVDKNDRTARALLRQADRDGVSILTTSGAVAQAWRDGSRQARLARLLRGVTEIELSRERSRRIGVLLGRAGMSDVVDASIVEAAVTGDEIVTSDPDDITALVAASGKTLVVTRI